MVNAGIQRSLPHLPVRQFLEWVALSVSLPKRLDEIVPLWWSNFTALVSVHFYTDEDGGAATFRYELIGRFIPLRVGINLVISPHSRQIAHGRSVRLDRPEVATP